MPDEATRLAALKRGEVDIAYALRGPLAEELRAHAGPHAQADARPTFTEWLVFTEQLDPKSPWADRRVRLAANLAIDRKAINDAEYLGFGRDQLEHHPARLPVLLARAGHTRTTRRRRSSSSPRPAIRAASTRSRWRPT